MQTYPEADLTSAQTGIQIFLFGGGQIRRSILFNLLPNIAKFEFLFWKVIVLLTRLRPTEKLKERGNPWPINWG